MIPLSLLNHQKELVMLIYKVKIDSNNNLSYYPITQRVKSSESSCNTLENKKKPTRNTTSFEQYRARNATLMAKIDNRLDWFLYTLTFPFHVAQGDRVKIINKLKRHLQNKKDTSYAYVLKVELASFGAIHLHIITTTNNKKLLKQWKKLIRNYPKTDCQADVRPIEHLNYIWAKNKYPSDESLYLKNIKGLSLFTIINKKSLKFAAIVQEETLTQEQLDQYQNSIAPKESIEFDPEQEDFLKELGEDAEKFNQRPPQRKSVFLSYADSLPPLPESIQAP